MHQIGKEDDMEKEVVGLELDSNQKHKKVRGEGAMGEEALSVERIFEGKEVPSWRKQLTVRAFVVSLGLSVLFSFIVMKLSLTTGVIPTLNVAAAVLGFFFVKTWTKFLEMSGLLKQPFTRQENTVIQTCVVASSGIAFSGGYGTYLLALSQRIGQQSPSNTVEFKNPSFGWITTFLLIFNFRGLFSAVLLRKMMIIDFKLTYPSGTATAHLINSFHNPQGAKLAKRQVRLLGKLIPFSFLWGFFQWFFTAGDDCGFVHFPNFGLKAYKNKFYFDFSTTYVGVGMICPHIINVSMLIGGILSWGLMWPLIENRKGDWFSAELSPSNFHGLQAYKVFLAIAMVLGDGIYNFVKVVVRILLGLYHQLKNKDVIPIADPSSPSTPDISYDDKRRTQLFLKDQIPAWFAIGGYVAIAVVSIITLPHIFPQLKWYYIFVIYMIAPILAFCNAYGCGLTDWSLESTYGKLAIFMIGAWAGASHGGVVAGLVACGVMVNIVSTTSDLMQDFKTGYITLASPRSMFASQAIGTTIGCVISPFVFRLFYKACDDLGFSGSEYPAPYAVLYRNMAEVAAEGFSNLPKHCLTLCCVIFVAAILMNLVRDLLGKKRGWFIPIPMAMAIPFYIGPYLAIDMCVGSLILIFWEKVNKAKADAFGPTVASGLICGDGIWDLASSILALAGVKPPICMKFLSRATNARVDKFLGS